MHQNLISVVKNNLDQISMEWAEEVKKSEFMKSYNRFSDEEIVNRARRVFEHLVIWLEQGAKSEEAEQYFFSIGKKRLEEGFTLSEVHYALYVTKKLFWNNVDWRDTVSGSFTNSNTTRILSLFNDYFDLSNFYVTRGYLHALVDRLEESKKFSKAELEAMLLKGSLSKQQMNEEDFVWRPV